MDVQTRPERGNSLGRASRPMTQQRKKVGIIVSHVTPWWSLILVAWLPPV